MTGSTGRSLSVGSVGSKGRGRESNSMGHSREEMRSSGELGGSSGLQDPMSESKSNSLKSTLSAIQSRPEKASSSQSFKPKWECPSSLADSQGRDNMSTTALSPWRSREGGGGVGELRGGEE